MFLVIIMMISLCACGGTDASGSSASDKSLYEQGLGVISLMAEAAQAEEAAKAAEAAQAEESYVVE